MYKKARLHFKKHDPKLHAAALDLNIEDIETSEDLFRDIVWTIIGQQLSGKAADSIFERFQKLFPAGLITPEKILKLSDTRMRNSGLSGAKVRALRDLSEKVAKGELNLE
jgi:3-methyladenine DNA glycosylase/8-oxoguanine DNA glycosylase